MGIVHYIITILAATVIQEVTSQEFKTDYLSTVCGGDLGTRVSGRLETSASLTYENLMDCSLRLAVADGNRIMLHFIRFDIEEKVDGKCVDVFTIHDGYTTSDPILNSGKQCGQIKQQFNISTSANKVLFTFTSDNNAQLRGFEIVYTQFHWGACSTDEYNCTNGMCIPDSRRCNGERECGGADSSDEAVCDEAALSSTSADDFPWGAVVGGVLGGILLIIIIAVVAYKIHDYVYWQKFLRENNFKSTSLKKKISRLYQYPVTDRYSKFDVGVKGRRRPDLDPVVFYGSTPLPPMAGAGEGGKDGERYMDEL